MKYIRKISPFQLKTTIRYKSFWNEGIQQYLR